MITVPPQMRNAGVAEMEYRKIAQQCMFRMNMARGSLPTFTQKFTLNNGVEVICSHCYGKEDVWVKIPPVVVGTVEVVAEETLEGIIFHPRSGDIELLPYTEYVSGPFGTMPETKYLPGVTGGWQDGKTLLTTDYIFPLVDADNASFVVSMPGDDLEGEFAGPLSNYGNLYWWNGDDEEPIFLSWKGTPTRHFRLPNNIDIPGFSVFETSTPGAIEDQPVYTTFGTALYQGGEVLAESPKWSWPYNSSGVGGRCLILGACQDTDGGIYIATQSDHYNAPENVFIFSDGHRAEGADSLKQTYLNGKTGVTCVFEKTLTKPGFFLTLWRLGGQVDGWSFVTEQSYSRTGLPWFANTDGSEFISSNGDRLTIAGDLTEKSIQYGKYKEIVPFINNSLAQCLAEFDATYTGTAYHEFGEAEVNSPVSVNFSAKTTFYDTADTYKNFGFNWPEVVHPDDPVVNMSMQPGTNVSYVTISGGMLPLSSNVGYFTNDRTLNFTGLCGTQNVTVTDACGLTLDLGPRRMPLGYWSYTITCGTPACGGIWTCSSKYLKSDCTWYDGLGYYLEDNSYMGSVTLNTGSAACIENPCDGSRYVNKGNIYQKFWVCP